MLLRIMLQARGLLVVWGRVADIAEAEEFPMTVKVAGAL